MARGTAFPAALHLWIILAGFPKRILEVRKWSQVDRMKGEIITPQFVDLVFSSVL